MVTSVDSQQQLLQLQQLQQSGKAHGHHKSPQSMFDNLNKAVGGDGKGITEDQLKTAAEKAQTDGNTKEANMLNKMISDFGKLSGGTDKITVSSLQQAMPAAPTQASGQSGQTSQTGQATGTAGCQPCTGCGRCNNGTQQTPGSVSKAQLQSPIDLNIV